MLYCITSYDANKEKRVNIILFLSSRPLVQLPSLTKYILHGCCSFTNDSIEKITPVFERSSTRTTTAQSFYCQLLLLFKRLGRLVVGKLV